MVNIVIIEILVKNKINLLNNNLSNHNWGNVFEEFDPSL